MNRPTPLIVPAQRTPWGIITQLRGPLPEVMQAPGPPHLRRANALLHGATITLSHLAPRYPRHRLFQVWGRFFDALTHLHKGPAPAWRVAYCFDRLGLVTQLLGCPDEAETWYLRSLALVDPDEWRPTRWNELTCLNLAMLYHSQGKRDLGAGLIAAARHMSRRRVERLGRLPNNKAGEHRPPAWVAETSHI